MSVQGYPSLSFQIDHGMWQSHYPGLSFIPSSYQRNLGEPNVGIIERGYYSRGRYHDANSWTSTESLGNSYQRARPLPDGARNVDPNTGYVYENRKPGFYSSSVSPEGMSNDAASENGYSWIGGSMRDSSQSFSLQSDIYHRHAGWSGAGGNAYLRSDDTNYKAMFPGIWRGDWNYYVYNLRFYGSVSQGSGFGDEDFFGGGQAKNTTDGKILVPARTDTGKFIFTSANGDNILASSVRNVFSGRDIEGERCGPYRSIKQFSLLKPVVHPDQLGSHEVDDVSCIQSYADDAEYPKIQVTINVKQASFNGIKGWMYEEYNSKASLPHLNIIMASAGNPADPHGDDAIGGHGHHGGPLASNVIVIEEDDLPD